MSDELTTYSHDAIVPMLWDINKFTDGVDAIIENAEIIGDPSEALDAGIVLVSAQQVSWLTLAKLIYELNERWGDVFESDHDFLTVASARWNKSTQYIQRLLEIWTWVIVAPKHKKKRLKILYSKPYGAMRQLVGLCRAGQMTEKLWKEVETAVTQQEIKQLREDVRGITGGAAHALRIMMENDGTLKVRKGEGEYKVCGVLSIEIDDEDVRAAIDRILREAGIFRR